MRSDFNKIYVAISPGGYLYGRGTTPEEAEEKAVLAWAAKFGGQADEINFIIKIDDGEYDI